LRIKYRKSPYLVPGTTYAFFNFLWMVVPGTNCSQKNFEKFFDLKRGFSTGIIYYGTKSRRIKFLFFFKISELISLRYFFDFLKLSRRNCQKSKKKIFDFFLDFLKFQGSYYRIPKNFFGIRLNWQEIFTTRLCLDIFQSKKPNIYKIKIYSKRIFFKTENLFLSF
jgi:hypothetical protein